MKITEPGIYEMTAEAYHADPCPEPSLSSHAIVTLLSKSPLHAWYENPRLNTDPDDDMDQNEKKFDVGTAAHRLILEGIDDIKVIDADSWRTKAAKEAAEEARAEGYTPLLAKHAKAVRQMAPVAYKAIAECEELDGLIREDFDAEKTLIWQEDGV